MEGSSRAAGRKRGVANTRRYGGGGREEEEVPGGAFVCSDIALYELAGDAPL